MSAILTSSANPQFATRTADTGVAARTPTGPAPGDPLPSQTVLVVDDDSSLRTVAARMLQCCGFKTVVAGNGLQALHQMEQNPQIGAVLLDMRMPVMDGEETLRQLRHSWATIPVIVTSGFNAGEIGRRFGNQPPDGFVQKPFTLDKLTSAFAGVLG
jgi:CheY-like chemotaxis protein